MRDRSYLDWLRTQPCAVTLYVHPDGNHPAHTFKSVNGGGMGMKSNDCSALPLVPSEHMKQSRMGEVQYWRDILMKDDVLVKQAISAYAQVKYYNRYLEECI